MKKNFLYGLCIALISCVSYFTYSWYSQCANADQIFMEDVEALSKDETSEGNNTFRTWVDTGTCYEMNSSGVLVSVGTYRICGSVNLGFTKNDDCGADEPCRKGGKI